MTVGTLQIVHVDVHVLVDHVDAFRIVTLTNARASIREPGCLRFDVMQDRDEGSHFVLVEIYRTTADAAAHKETSHYAAWRDAVAPMMARPRTSQKYMNWHPDDVGF